MKGKYAPKILAMSLALALILPVIAKADIQVNEDGNTALYAITSVSPSAIDNYTDTNITLTGTGFSAISQLRMKLGDWHDDSKDEVDHPVQISVVHVVNDTTITATIPAGTEAADNKSITIFDAGVTPNTHYTLENIFSIHPSFEVDEKDADNNNVVVVFESSRKNSTKYFNLTFRGKTITKKGWLKVKVGNRTGKIVSARKSGHDTIIRTKFNYGKMTHGSYNISLNYKDSLKKRVLKNGKVKYIKQQERGMTTNNNAFVVLLQPTQ